MRRMVKVLALSTLLAGAAWAQETGGGVQPVPIRHDSPQRFNDPRHPEPPPPIERQKAEAPASTAGGVTGDEKPHPLPIRRNQNTRPKDPRHPEPPPPEAKK